MKVRPNLKVAVGIAVVHFSIGVVSAVMNASEALSVTGGGSGWQAMTFIFTFPLTTLFELVHHREGFGFGRNLLAMMVQSFGWGLLISLLFPPRSSSE